MPEKKPDQLEIILAKRFTRREYPEVYSLQDDEKVTVIKMKYNGDIYSGKRMDPVLVDILKQKSNLKEIHLQYDCRFQSDTSSGEIIKDIIDIVNNNDAISRLAITHFPNINDDIAKEFAEFIKNNRSLKKINFVRNILDMPSFFKLIVSALAENTSLQEFDLFPDKIKANISEYLNFEPTFYFNKLNKLLTNNVLIRQALAKTFLEDDKGVIQNLLTAKGRIAKENEVYQTLDGQKCLSGQNVEHVMVRSMHSLQDLALNAVHNQIVENKLPLSVAEICLSKPIFDQLNPNISEDNSVKIKSEMKLSKTNFFQPLQAGEPSSSEPRKTIYWQLGKA